MFEDKLLRDVSHKLKILRSILENAGAVMGERTLLWDMSILHPGLQMKVGPSLSGGLLEFILDPSHQYDDRSHAYEESTGEEK